MSSCLIFAACFRIYSVVFFESSNPCSLVSVLACTRLHIYVLWSFYVAQSLMYLLRRRNSANPLSFAYEGDQLFYGFRNNYNSLPGNVKFYECCKRSGANTSIQAGKHIISHTNLGICTDLTIHMPARHTYSRYDVAPYAERNAVLARRFHFWKDTNRTTV